MTEGPGMQSKCQKTSALFDIPFELQAIFLESNSNLKYVNRYYYQFNNVYYRSKLFKEFGSPLVLYCIRQCCSGIVRYVKSFDFLRKEIRQILEPQPSTVSDNHDIDNMQYISDSWEVIYYLFKYRKIYPLLLNFEILEKSDNEIYKENPTYGSVIIERSNHVSMKQRTFLPKNSDYYLYLVLKVNSSYISGLGTMSFTVDSRVQPINLPESDIPIKDDKYQPYSKNIFYAATFIEDLISSKMKSIEDEAVVHLKIGKFSTKVPSLIDGEDTSNLISLNISITEFGLKLKSGIEFLYFDFLKAPASVLQPCNDSFISENSVFYLEQNEKYPVNLLEKLAQVAIENCIKVFYSVEDDVSDKCGMKNTVEKSVSLIKDEEAYCQEYCLVSERYIKFVSVIEKRKYEGVKHKDIIDGKFSRWKINWLENGK